MKTARIACLMSLGMLGASVPAHATNPSPDHPIIRSAQAMGTRVTVTIWGDDDERAARAAAEVFAEFDRIDAAMTSWGDTSVVAQINAAAGSKAVPVGDELLAVLDKALEVAKQTNGAFDITVGTFRGLWKFDQDLDGTIPTAEQIKARQALVGYRGVRVNHKRKTVRLARKGMRITLGGIAKGYAVDRSIALLRTRGFVDFILQAGGDLFVAGKRGDRPWRVGIRDPRGERSAVFAIAEIQDRTFSTSGDYERSLVTDGVRYHHILDPSTGYPAKLSRSVTVMAADAMTADAWSTALFVLGAERGVALVERMPQLDAVFVDKDNKVHSSSGLKNKLWIQKQPTGGL